MPIILIVDDPGILLETQRTFLHRNGFLLVPVAGGEESLRLAREKKPDLIVLDAAKSSPEGLETCSRFKSDPQLQGIPLVIVGSLRDRQAAKLAGAEGFVPRPVTQASLLSQVRRFVTASERANSRLPVGFKVTCRTGDGGFVAFSRDLSSTGMFLKSSRPPSKGSFMLLSFVLPGERPVPIETEAEVIRVVLPDPSMRLTAGTGLRFTTLAAEIKIEIGRFVRAGEASA